MPLKEEPLDSDGDNNGEPTREEAALAAPSPGDDDDQSNDQALAAAASGEIVGDGGDVAIGPTLDDDGNDAEYGDRQAGMASDDGASANNELVGTAAVVAAAAAIDPSIADDEAPQSLPPHDHEYYDDEAVSDQIAAVYPSVPPAEGASPPPASANHDSFPKAALRVASRIKDKSERDRALVAALGNCRRELEDAESADARAVERLRAAKEVYDHCARLLAGYTPLGSRLEKRADAAADRAAKRVKRERSVMEAAALQRAAARAAAAGDALSSAPPPRAKGQVQTEGEEIVLPANEICLPEYFTAGGGMMESMVAAHRDNFFLRLTRGQADASTIDEWAPPPNNANLKSRAQLEEWIHIATHWNTGADGMDAGAFRARHKTWYSRMKPVTYNLGRRTGIHLRQLDAGGYEGRDVKGMTMLCRYNKAGNKSTVYLDVGRLFDALFQIHALELNHRGRDATKNLADERYANIPDGTVRAFLETCPICNARRGSGLPPPFPEPTDVPI